MLTSVQSAGVAPEMNLMNSMQARKGASKKSTLALKPIQMSPEVQNRGISGPTKRTHVLQKFREKKTACFRTVVFPNSVLKLSTHPEAEGESKTRLEYLIETCFGNTENRLCSVRSSELVQT